MMHVQPCEIDLFLMLQNVLSCTVINFHMIYDNSSLIFILKIILVILVIKTTCLHLTFFFNIRILSTCMIL